jgi:hypothetical protein
MNAAGKGRRAEHRAATVARNATPEEKRNPNELHTKAKPSQTPVQARAALAVEGLVTNTVTTLQWSSHIFGEEAIDLTAAVEAVFNASARVRNGDLGELEMLLTSQVVAMNAMFANLASRAKTATYLDHFDKYMRLALKAQGQCRATAETLAMMKNPPLFARQANIASGPQQINNGPVLNGRPARAEISESEPNKLLEAAVDGERLDDGTAATAGAGDSPLATLAEVHRTADARGHGACVPQRVQGRRAADIPRADAPAPRAPR